MGWNFENKLVDQFCLKFGNLFDKISDNYNKNFGVS